MVHRQEAQALAEEAIREEADVQDGCRELLTQLLHSLPPLQEGTTSHFPVEIWRISEVLPDGQDTQSRLGRDDRVVNHHRLFQGVATRRAFEKDWLRPERKVHRWKRWDGA